MRRPRVTAAGRLFLALDVKPSLTPVRPSAAITADYRKRLDALIREMQDSLVYWIRAKYRANEPEIAQDASPAMTLRTLMRRLTRRWQRKFDEIAPQLAQHFAQAVQDRSDTQFRNILRDGGFTVKWKASAAQNDVLQAVVGENVDLIKSIASQHLTQVQGLVMRSVQEGRDLATLSRELQTRYGVSARRAAFIARDQNNKATAAMTRVRQKELGVKKAKWLHSAGGKEPRPSHVAFSGKTYDVDKGALIDGARIFPGQLPNCFPGHTLVTPIGAPLAVWRTSFDGPMVDLRVGSDLLQGTPNHPVLTRDGWRPLQTIEEGDEVLCMVNEKFGEVDHYEDQSKPTFLELFEAGARVGGNIGRAALAFDFHGDLTHGDVDEVVFIDPQLWTRLVSERGQQGEEFSFPQTDSGNVATCARSVLQVVSPNGAGLADDGATFFPGSSDETLNVGVRFASELYARSTQDVTDVSGGMAGASEPSRDSRSPQAFGVEAQDIVSSGVPIEPLVATDASGTEVLADLVGRMVDSGGGFLQQGPVRYELRRVVEKCVRNFSGHVFTMQTTSGHYGVGGAFVQAKNCRCVSVPVIPGFDD